MLREFDLMVLYFQIVDGLTNDLQTYEGSIQFSESAHLAQGALQYHMTLEPLEENVYATQNCKNGGKNRSILYPGDFQELQRRSFYIQVCHTLCLLETRALKKAFCLIQRVIVKIENKRITTEFPERRR